MSKLLLVCTVLSLLLYTIIGLVPLKHLPHEHILLGPVTPEQFRAHLAQEEGALQSASRPDAMNVSATPTGGRIISIGSAFNILIASGHLEFALQFLLLPVFLLIFHTIFPSRFRRQTNALPSSDPPPRLGLVSF